MTKHEYLILTEQVVAARSKATDERARCLAFIPLTSKVNALSHAERRALRAELEAEKCPVLVRNLYFDYETQEWI